MGGFFDVHICGFSFLCVNDADPVHLLDLAVAALYAVGVKHDYQLALTEALIVSEYIDQCASRAVDISLGELVEVFPRENHVIAVNEHILRAVVGRLFLLIFRF